MKTIFDKTTMNGLNLKNRLFRSATWEGLANRDGSPPKEQVQMYAELAEGGVGGIIAGFTSVSSDDTYFEGMMRLSDDQLIPAYQMLTEKVKMHDCVFLTQIALGAYDKLDESGRMRRIEIDDMSEDDIHDVVELFTQASLRAQKAGFDGVQIHAAHGFFLSRCISPAYNHRVDSYGGSPQGRAKILTDILEGIKDKTKDFHVSIKINCSDFTNGGLTSAQSLMICQLVANMGIDSIEVSGNYTSRTGIKPMVNEAYFLDFALELKKTVDTPVIVVGGHRSMENMNRIVNESNIEYLSLSRPLIREPALPKRWQSGDLKPATCISCNACYRTHAHKCIFNRGK